MYLQTSCNLHFYRHCVPYEQSAGKSSSSGVGTI
jgi:hypothetical protein